LPRSKSRVRIPFPAPSFARPTRERASGGEPPSNEGCPRRAQRGGGHHRPRELAHTERSSDRRRRQVVRQRSAKPPSPVQIRAAPPNSSSNSIVCPTAAQAEACNWTTVDYKSAARAASPYGKSPITNDLIVRRLERVEVRRTSTLQVRALRFDPPRAGTAGETKFALTSDDRKYDGIRCGRRGIDNVQAWDEVAPFKIASVIAAVYFVVRGLDNLKKGLEEKRLARRNSMG
jgi:hypothetical protein